MQRASDSVMSSGPQRVVRATGPLVERVRWERFMNDAAVWWLGVTATGRGRIEIMAHDVAVVL